MQYITSHKILLLNLKYLFTFQQTNYFKTILVQKIIFIKMSNKQKYSLLFIHFLSIIKNSINLPFISLVSHPELINSLIIAHRKP